MKLHKKGFRRFGVGVILSWSLVPIYWVINTSFQTDAQISDTPAHLFPPTPGWANYKALCQELNYLFADSLSSP